MTLKNILITSAIAVSFMTLQATAYDHHEGDKAKAMETMEHGKKMKAMEHSKKAMAKCAKMAGEEKAKCIKHAKKAAKKNKKKHVKEKKDQ